MAIPAAKIPTPIIKGKVDNTLPVLGESGGGLSIVPESDVVSGAGVVFSVSLCSISVVEGGVVWGAGAVVVVSTGAGVSSVVVVSSGGL